MKTKPNFRVKHNQKSVYRPKQQTNAKRSFWEKNERTIIFIGTVLITEGIRYLFNCLREDKKTNAFKERADYANEKRRDDRQKKREEEATAQEKAQRQAEDDPVERLNQKDKDVKNYVFRTLGLDSEEALLKERVFPSDRTSRSKRLPLVGSLLYRGDLALLVSNPGVGKSAMGYDMADSIAKGMESKLFHEPQGHQSPQTVYYFDAEMNSDDMGERYPQGLSENFVRIPVKTPRRNVYYLLKDIIEIIGLDDITSDKTLVIDNITAAAFKMDAKVLLAGLKSIQAMFEKEGCRLTAIVVVHTTKEAKDRPELEDVAGSADLTRLTTKVLFLNPTEHEGVVRINDGKHRATKKNKDLIVKLKGGVGFDENLHFEAAENVMSEEELQKLMDELDDNAPKKPGRPQKLSEDEIAEIIEELSEGATIKSLAKKYGVVETTIRNIKNSNRG